MSNAMIQQEVEFDIRNLDMVYQVGNMSSVASIDGFDVFADGVQVNDVALIVNEGGKTEVIPPNTRERHDVKPNSWVNILDAGVKFVGSPSKEETIKGAMLNEKVKRKIVIYYTTTPPNMYPFGNINTGITTAPSMYPPPPYFNNVFH
jgi:hypothetical protein